MTSQEGVKLLFHTLKERERTENKLKELNKSIESLRSELYEVMDEEGFDSLEFEGIKFEPDIKRDFVLNGQYKGMQWDYVEEVMNWFEQHYPGLAKIKKSIHPQTRAKQLKDHVDNNLPLPEFIKEVFHNTIKFNKSAIKRLVENE